MFEVNFWAIIVASVAAFVLSTAWYMIFGKEMARLQGVKGDSAEDRPPAWKMLAEIARSFVFSYVLAYFMALAGVTDLPGALQLGLLTWIGFPAVLLAGSVMWESVPPKLAAIHAGDWLAKILLAATILGLWR